MNRLMQDMQYALRQLRKAPGFTLTAVLTLALGIGANAAIFSLVHAVLLRNLPVADPKTLVRVGDTDDCCVNGGTPDENKYSLFAYDLYKHLRDNTPEFEQLAAMQAGFGYGSVTARSSKPEALPKALVGELVSGNYFQTFGLRPYAGRLLAATDDVEGAPMAAVMSYQTWQRDYALDPSVVGSTFVLNTNPVTIIGITPPGFYGDRMTDFSTRFFHSNGDGAGHGADQHTAPASSQLGLHPGAGEAGDGAGSAAGEDERRLAQLAGAASSLSEGRSEEKSGAIACCAYAWRSRHRKHAAGIWQRAEVSDVDLSAGAADRVCQHCEPGAGTRTWRGVRRLRYAWRWGRRESD